jgi:DUF4097 and DUF4098 domain-containing protein YvlB
MKTTRIVTIICWCISALALTGLLVWFLLFSPLAGLGNNGFLSFNLSAGGFESLTGPYNPVGTQTLSQDGVDSFSIDWVSGSVTIKPHDEDTINITEFAQRELNSDEQMKVTTNGSTVKVEYTEGNRFVNMPNKRLEVLLPHSLSNDLANLLMNSTSGSKNISDISANTIDLDTTSGNISITNVDAGEIRINCTSGTIDIAGSVATDLRTDSTSGTQRVSGTFDNINISGTSGSLTIENEAANATVRTSITSGVQHVSGSFNDVDMRSTSASISLLSRQVPSSLSINNTSGSIDITVPNEGPVSVDHSSTSGRFSSEIPVIMQSGSNAAWRISSTSGNLTINELR